LLRGLRHVCLLFLRNETGEKIFWGLRDFWAREHRRRKISTTGPAGNFCGRSLTRSVPSRLCVFLWDPAG